MIEVQEVSGYEQLERWVVVRNEIEPDDPENVEMMTFVRAHEPDHVDLLAFVDGEPVGTAMLAGDPLSADSTHPYVELGVLPAFRRRGVGTVLLREVSARARALGKLGLTGHAAVDDAAGGAFLRAHDFTPRRSYCNRIVDLRDLPAQRELPPGIEIAWLAQRPELLSEMYEVAAETYPRLGGWISRQADTLADWQTYELADPSVLFDLTAVAVAEGVVAGYGTLLRVDDRTGRVRVATAREGDRFRGAVPAIVDAQLHAARAAGFERVRLSSTIGDLGYPAVEREIIVFEGPLLD
jgi:GNAT superfamily N-acetyltransferase